jgi:tetratricopeptide (TPR) repeat protein
MRVGLSVCLAAGLLYLGHQGWRRAREYRFELQAAAAPDFSTEKVRALEKAFAIDPWNFSTAQMIGESLRIQSSEGGTDTRQLAEQSMEWFQRAMRLNPWKPNAFWGCGWCLDWLDRSTDAKGYYAQAGQLDPQNYEILNRIGLHHVQNRDFAGARPYFERSLRLMWENNPTARNYLGLANARLLEAATNDFNARLIAPAGETR